MTSSITSGTYPRAVHATTPGGLQRFGGDLWRALRQVGTHRVHPELMRMARQKADTDPALAEQLREAARSMLKG